MELSFLGAIESVGSARRHLAEGAIRPCSREIQRAWDILRDLKKDVEDPVFDPAWKRNLVSLFAYLQTRLMEANSQRSDSVLREVEDLLFRLQGSWETEGPLSNGLR